MYEGEGKLYDPETNMLVYEGNFREGAYDGEGKLYEGGILAYEGEFLLGAYNGTGKLYDQETGGITYEGVFYNNIPLVEAAAPGPEPEPGTEPGSEPEPEVTEGEGA